MDGALTAVTLIHRPELADDWLRFGDPVATREISPRRSCSFFVGGAVFAFVRWRGGDYGTTLWRLWVLRAGEPGDAVETISGMSPGAAILFSVRSEEHTSELRH